MKDASVLPAGATTTSTTAGQDLLNGLLQANVWGRLGWLEVKRRYQRTAIGPFWSAISLGVFVLALGGVGAGLWSQQQKDYLPFLAAGMVVWVMISSMISEACVLFVASANLFRQMRFNYSVLAYALVWRNFIVFLHNLIVYALAVLMLAPQLITPTALLAVPGLALVLVNISWVALSLGIFCLRFRDLTQLVNTVIQIAMFVTPIFWPPDSLKGPAHIIFVDLNPLYHLITVVRAPLLAEVPSSETYAAVALMTVVGWGATYFLFGYFRKRIAYWS
jgi:ABC-type polysaccharide/polyol phosphate export permease